MAEGWLLHNALQFLRLLRRLGLPVDTQRALLFGLALDEIGVADRQAFYHAARCCLIYRQGDLAAFDRAFQAFWRTPRHGGIPLSVPGPAARPNPAVASPAATRGLEAGPSGEQAAAAYSPVETLRQRDFADLDHAERQAIRALIAGLSWRPEQRRSRRLRAGRGPLPDPRRTFRSGLRYGGELLIWELRRPKRRPRPLVLLADVSGSMEPYTRIVLQLLYSLTHGLEQPLEAFVFSTRLTRVTHWLRARDVQEALRSVSRAVPDWSGGTRIGEALRQFNRVWARRVLTHGAVVVVLSDGLDRGQTVLLGRELARLRRSCRRLIWLNPLLGSPGYAPLAAGMRAALPHVDEFLPAHNLASLESLADLLSQAPVGRAQQSARGVPPVAGPPPRGADGGIPT